MFKKRDYHRNIPKIYSLGIEIILGTENSPITNMSTFILEKSYQHLLIQKQSKNVKENGTRLIVEHFFVFVLLKMDAFYTPNIKAHPHQNLNASKGVVRHQ